MTVIDRLKRRRIDAVEHERALGGRRNHRTTIAAVVSAREHGIDNAHGHHAGDLPNVHVPPSGELSVTVFNRDVTLDAGKNSVFDADGSALVIHAGPDDYRSNPGGNAGDRVACGVIVRAR